MARPWCNLIPPCPDLGHRRILTTEPHPAELKCTWRLEEFSDGCCTICSIFAPSWECSGAQSKKPEDGTTRRFRQKAFFDFVDTESPTRVEDPQSQHIHQYEHEFSAGIPCYIVASQIDPNIAKAHSSRTVQALPGLEVCQEFRCSNALVESTE